MSNMRQLLESISNFSVADPKAPEVKEGEECETCHKDPCQCDDEKAIAEELMQEYKYFVSEADPPVAGQPTSPVAAVNPPGSGNPAVGGAPATNTATSQTGAAPKPGAPAPAPAAGTPPAGQPPKPGAPAPAGATAPPPGATGATPASPAQAAAAKPGAPSTGAPGAGSATLPNPQQVKQSTDAVTKILNNPSDPMNAELTALLKKSGQIPH